MRLAYADPPYLGCAKFYPEHPDAAKWNDVAAHVALIEGLDRGYDGWAFSASTPSLRPILSELGSQVNFRIAAWTKPFAAYKRNVRIAYAWEPVLFWPGRDSSADGAPVGRDFLREPITMKKGLTGAKPERFCRWVLDLLGYVPGDEFEDLFPGTGSMGRVLEHYQEAMVL